MTTGQNNVHEIGDFRAMPVNAWMQLYASFDSTEAIARSRQSPAAKDVFCTPLGTDLEDSPFRVPEDPAGTPQGPNLTPGKPLGFLTSGTTSPTKVLAACRDAFRAALGAEPVSSSRIVVDDDSVPMLEAVEPIFAAEIPEEVVSPTGSGSPTSKAEGMSNAWKRITAALPQPRDVSSIREDFQEIRVSLSSAMPQPRNVLAIREDFQEIRGEGIPNAARQMSAQAIKAKEQVSETVIKAKENALKVPAQMTETAQKGMGFVKGQTETVRKVPAQVSESAQKSFGFAKEKAGTARDKAQTVSAAVTAKVTQTTQKGMDLARSLTPRAQGKVGGA